MQITFQTDAGSHVLASGTPAQPVSGLQVGVAWQSILLNPIDGVSIPTPGFGRAISCGFVVTGRRASALAGVSDFTGRVTNEHGTLTVQAPNASASLVFWKAACTSRKRSPVAGAVQFVAYTFSAVDVMSLSGSTDLILLDVDGTPLADVDGELLEDVA